MKKRKSQIPLISVSAFLVVALVAAFVMLLVPMARHKAMIRIPQGATRQQVHDSLAKYLGEGYASRVMGISGTAGLHPEKRHGLYAIPSGASPLRAAWTLGRRAQTPVTLVINGQRTTPELVSLVVTATDNKADAVDSILTSPSFLRQYGLTPDNAMALFLNNSFQVYWSADAATVLKKLGDNYNKFWNDSRRRKASALGLRPDEVVTLASIVEEESNVRGEHGRIARLYMNRMKKGMRLQADPTVKYAVGDFAIKRVTKEMLFTQSPYNTYRNAGLPPGPIRAVDPRTIDAVLDAPATVDLYMCANPDFSGTHIFASTFEEHTRNAREYQKALNRADIH